MKYFNFALGMSGTAEVYLDIKGLNIKIKENNEEYSLPFKDGVFLNRKFYDGAAYQKGAVFCKAFHEDVITKVKDNQLEIVSCPLNEKTKTIVNDILITNRFTFSKETSSIIQETFYELKKQRYDISHIVGQVDLKANGFLTAENNEQGISCNIADLPNNIGFQEMIILRKDKKCLKIKGGMTCICDGILDSHLYSILFNDRIEYYNEDNPIFTTYAFGDAPVCEFPVKEINKRCEDNVFKISSGKINLQFTIKKDSIAFLSNDREQSFAEVELRNLATGEEFFIDTLSLWESVEASQNNNNIHFVFQNPFNGKIKGISLIITAECFAEKSRIEWSVEVLNTTSQYSVLNCTYPRLYISSKETLDLFVPEFGGVVRKNFNACDNYVGGAYPSGFRYPMAYYALYNKSQCDGIYYAIHDKDAALKDFYAASSQNGEVKLSCRFHSQNYGDVANSQKLPGKAVWQIFNGDWFDATKIYKEFVEAECDWYVNIKDKKTPEWMKEIPFWVMDWVPYDPESGEVVPTNLRSDNPDSDIDEWYKNPIKLRKELGVPIGYHVYNWHQIPFNNDYPHFMPAKERFVKALPILKENSVRVMPYINALLWDNQDKGDEDFEFEEFGRPGAVKTESGDVAILTYEARKKNGEKVELSPMCPSYKLWRDKLTDLVTKMFDELDVDAIYLDQIAARIPHLCMDENHSHPKGGGDWWQKNYRELLKQLNEAKPHDKAFTTESNAEVYSADIDGFLSWMWTGSFCDVPAFMQVYSNSVCVFGRSTNGAVKSNDLFWKYHLAKELVCGQQMGWINSDFVNNSARLEFVKKLAVFRYENKEFFKNAIVMRPPVIKATKEHTFHSRLAMYHIGFMNSPYIVGGLLANGDGKKLILVNICDKPMTDEVEWNEDEYNLSSANYTVIGAGTIKILSENTMECAIDAESFICIEW